MPICYALEKDAGLPIVRFVGFFPSNRDYVITHFNNRSPSWRQQLTAYFAAAVVLMLTVLAVSPQLHDWVHGNGSAPVKAHTSTPGYTAQVADHDDSGCVVTIFANGVVLAALGLMAIAALWQSANFILRMETAAYRQTPRYWLPPLCGPPLS